MANPLSRRLLQLAGLLSLLLIAVVVNYLLHDGSEVVSPIAEAAQRTAAMPGARLKLEVTYSSTGGSESMVGTGTGVYNAHTGRTDAQLTVTLPDGGSGWVESLGDDRTVYTRGSPLESALPPGKLWLGMQPLLGHDVQNALSAGPGAHGTLEELKAAGGDVEEIGHQVVRGHPATRYKSTIELSHVADFLREGGHTTLAREYEALAERAPDPVPVEVWIDGNGLLRLVRMVQQLPTASGGPTLTMDVRTEFFDFGIHPKIPLPPPDRVFDYTPVLRAELGLDDGHSLGPLDPPAGAKPLPAATFRSRANRICGRSFAAARRMLPRGHRLLEQLGRFGPGQLQAGEAKPTLIAIGRWIEGPLYRLWHRQFGELVALAPPSRQAASYRRYLTLDAQGTEWALAEARAFQLGAAKVPNSDDHKAEEERHETERAHLAAALGISSCQKNFDLGEPSGEPA